VSAATLRTICQCKLMPMKCCANGDICNNGVCSSPM
jgi:hypothetical protein